MKRKGLDDVFMALFRYCCNICLETEDPEETYQDSCCHSQDLNWTPPKYRSEV